MPRDYIDYALRDAGAVEVRHHADGRWRSGVFNDPMVLRQALRDAAATGNVYTTLNAPDAPAGNAMGGRPLADADIRRVVRIPFDFDPARPPGTPSTAAELQCARAARNRLVAALSALGWPAPAMATSGNGAHAVYRCSLPNDAATRERFAALYRGLRAEFSTHDVAFDPTVRNPARIWRAYGTTNRKGAPSAERPHRIATVAIPSKWDAVSPRLVDALANRYAQTPAVRPAPTAAPRVVGAGDYRTLDVVAWMAARGLYRRPLGSGKHAVTCPWEHEHSTRDAPHGTSTVVWDADPGLWPTFHCSHAHCDGRGIADVMALFGDADRFCASTWRPVR